MHDSWARVYDFVYDECFGATFARLTDATLALIERTQPRPARVLDLGAGTGRLAIPLALRGYDVTAVERSPGMADRLAERACRAAAPVRLRRGDFRELDAVLGRCDGTRADGGVSSVSTSGPARSQVPGPAACEPTPAAGPGEVQTARFDIALAVFTVLNYLVAEADVAAFARGVAARLRPGGHVVFDLAERRLFASALFESERLHREIDVSELSPDVFRYRDAGCGVFEGERFQYDDRLTLRYWRPDELLWILARHGLTMTADATEPLRASGSRWFVLEKEG